MKRLSFLKVILPASLLIIMMCFPAWGRTIKIGVIGPMNFVQGKGHWNGAVMAAEEINAKGGVQVGKEKMKIELIKSDSNEFLNLTDATNAMERLITSDKVDFIVGGFRTEAVLAMQDIAMDNKKIFIGCRRRPSGTLPCGWPRTTTATNTSSGSPRSTPIIWSGPVSPIWALRGQHQKRIESSPSKCAIVAEKAVWVDPMVEAAKGAIPKMGLEAGRDLAAFGRRDRCDRGTLRHPAERRQPDLYHFFLLGGDSLCPAGRGTQDPGRPGGHQCGSAKRRILGGHQGDGELCPDHEYLYPGGRIQ